MIMRRNFEKKVRRAISSGIDFYIISTPSFIRSEVDAMAGF